MLSNKFTTIVFNKYIILSLVRTPGNRRNVFALSGIRINRNFVLFVFLLTRYTVYCLYHVYVLNLFPFRFKPAIEELVSKTKVEVLLLENSIKSITKLSESVEQKNTDCLKKVQDTISQYTEALIEYEQELRQKVLF